MTRQEFTFLSADGKTRLYAVEWLPEGPVRGVVQISHGVGEHILRYEPMAQYLTDRGFAAAGHDHLGHGRSVPPDGVRQYFGPKGSWQWVAADLYTRRKLLAKRFPGAPCCLLGHSMGSFLARTYLIRFPGTVDAAIIMGTGQMPPAMIRAAQTMANEECLRVGEDKVSPVADKLAFGAYNQRFAPSRTPSDWLSRSEANVDAFLADPLCGGSASVGLFREMLGGMAFIQRPENLKRMNLNTPVLFASGEEDPVGDFGKGVQRAFRSFQRAGVRDVSIQLYPGLRHEILNEDCGEEICRDLYQWLLEKLPSADIA